MMNLNQIQRLVRLSQHRQLIERILPTGRCRSRQAVECLMQAEHIEAAALGLGLMRACELSYLPMPLGRELAARLLKVMRPDRLFGCGAEPSVAASAAALRGLVEWRELCESVGQDVSDLRDVISRSLDMLASLRHSGGLLGGDAVGSAIALALLGDLEEFRAAVDARKLGDAVDRCSGIAFELCRYAHAIAA